MTTHAQFGQPESDAVMYQRALGMQEGSRAFRARCRAILGAPEASGARLDLAMHLALETEMTAEDAIAALGAAPKGDTASGARRGEAFYTAQLATAAGRTAEDEPGLRSRFVRDSVKEFTAVAAIATGGDGGSRFISESRERFAQK